ncbi:hypoxanthine phosphoribosyltransferase [Plebeiibacterium marinum]|uniref:Hypoxanthine phosphoribosyltransferase n=1 Tax=Plebeiibacterium marinum TaxID=2992111 RepID=A0AAE3SJ80_9BACT|nr:hypoxanthine phosphoribosyltransferase [Plebeiobacterium marinum]MCW3805133.1 hypoxanthine phosphoribosyltransferase [Plebeiobacterium marinum]
MKRIKLLDKEFELSIPFETIDKAIEGIAQKMNEELADKDPLMICVLNGSFMFAADLMKKLNFPCEISFVKLSSYQGTSSTGKVKELIGLNENIEGRCVVVLEDIIDTGFTIEKIQKQLEGYQPSEVKIATMLYKPEACKVDLTIDYKGMDIPNDFIVGYGLDYDGHGRNLANIYTVVK